MLGLICLYSLVSVQVICDDDDYDDNYDDDEDDDDDNDAYCY